MLETSSNHLRSYVRHICAEAASPTDGILWDRFVRVNDQHAFEVLVHRHGSMVLACAQRVLSDRSESEDVFQATFLSLARAKQKIRQPEAMTSWLYQTAFRIAIKLRAKRLSTSEPALENVATANQETDLAWREVRSVLDEELQRLPDDLRSPLLLCYLDGLTRDETAKQLGCSFDQLKRKLEKGRDLLRLRLERRGIVGAALALAIISPDMLCAKVSPGLIEKLMGWVKNDSTVPQTVALLLASANTLSKGVVMKSLIATTLCVGAGIWGFANVGGGVEPQEKGAPPTEAPVKQAEKANPAEVKKSDEDSRRAGAQQSHLSLNHLKEIMLAIHNYESAYGYLPIDIHDKMGKPLLSWRVGLLPYLGQHQLFQQFKLDEPWDSESNLKLLPKMPDVFRVGFEPKNATNTYYRAFSGAGVPLMPVDLDAIDEEPLGGNAPGGSLAGAGAEAPVPKKAEGPVENPKPKDVVRKNNGRKRYIGQKLTSITDGTSTTLGVVEAGPPVPWTKPGGIPFDIKKPTPELAGPFENVLHVSTMDGATHALRRNLPDATLRILIGMNDGNITPDLKTLQQPFPPSTPEEKAELKKRIEANHSQIKQLHEQYMRQIKFFEKIADSSDSFVEAEEIKLGLIFIENRMKKEMEQLEADFAKKKKDAVNANK